MGHPTGTRVAVLVVMMKSLLAIALAGAAGCAGSATVEEEAKGSWLRETLMPLLEPFPAIPSQGDSALRSDVACLLPDLEARHGTRLQSGLT